MKKVEITIERTRRIIGELKETLNPGTCRCFVDAFLNHKENLEVRNFNSGGTAGIQNKTLPRDRNHSLLIPFVLCAFNSDHSLVFQESDVNAHYYHEDNLLHSAMNLFGAGTDTTATTLQWGLLYITKYPHIQGANMPICLLKFSKAATFLCQCNQMGSRRSSAEWWETARCG